jgi:cob(I)alamin adenosyltransferase
MKIYTKTGDDGKTGLIGGTRVSKNDNRIEAYGTVDELNSFLGLLASYQLLKTEQYFLEKIQHRLFAIGSYLATDTSKIVVNEASIIHENDIYEIEQEIDRLNENLPKLTNFILPGGSIEGSTCHICRTVSRRAERRILNLTNTYVIDIELIKYINRLSDYFFVLSRYITLSGGYKEIIWKQTI